MPLLMPLVGDFDSTDRDEAGWRTRFDLRKQHEAESHGTARDVLTRTVNP